MKSRLAVQLLTLALLLPCTTAQAAPPPSVPDPALAAELGADDRGMRKYIFVLLKTGPVRVHDGQERTEMFKGHFANMERLAKEKKLVAAGPFTGGTEWRGMFILAVPTVAEAEALVAMDPVIVKGEMVAEYQPLHASAALMALNEIHEKISPRQGGEP